MLEQLCECYSDLSCPILCPMLGSITPLFIPNSRIRLLRLIGVCASYINFLYPSVLWIQFDPILFLGINGISLFFMLLTTFLIPICISVGWSGMRSYGKEYITTSLILENLIIYVFCILDPQLFYVFSRKHANPDVV